MLVNVGYEGVALEIFAVSIMVVESNQFHVDKIIKDVEKVVPVKVPATVGCTVT